MNELSVLIPGNNYKYLLPVTKFKFSNKNKINLKIKKYIIAGHDTQFAVQRCRSWKSDNSVRVHLIHEDE